MGLLRWLPSQCPWRQEASGWGRGLQWWPHPLHTNQQWCLVSIVPQASSENFPGCGVPSSCSFRLSLHSQQLSPPWVCSPKPTSRHPAPLCTRRHTTQAGVHRAAAQTMHTVLTCPAFRRPLVAFPSDPTNVPSCPS